MAGIKANTVSRTMVDGDTSANNTVSSYLKNEKVTLSVTPTGSIYAWTIAQPSGSAQARSALSSATDATPTFTPDVGGEYLVTVTVDGSTSYTLIISVVAVSATSAVEAIRFPLMADAQVVAPSAASIAVYNSTERGGLSIKHSDGEIRHIPVSGSLTAAFVEMYMSTATATAIASSDTWTKIAGTTTIGTVSQFDDDSGTANRLRYTGVDTTTFEFHGTLSVVTSSPNNTLRFALFKNGSVYTPSIMEDTISTNGDTIALPLSGLVSMSTNDYLELYTKNMSGTGSVTVKFLNFVVTQSL